MMTYDQFLKQLRRIGRQLIFAGVAMAIINLIVIGPIDLLKWATDILVPSFILVLLGICILPFKKEE